MPGSSDRLRTTVARLARCAGHVVVAVLCLEAAARIDDRLSYGAPLWGRYDADRVRTRDEEGVPRNVPGARFEKWRINPLGFRGEPVAAAPTDGRRRIACLGTSETFGLFEGEGGEWPARLGQLLRERRADAEVVNAAVVGLNRGNRDRYFERYVAPLRPDVVVLYLSVLSDASYRPEASRPDAAPAPGVDRSWRELVPSSRVLPKLKQVIWSVVPAWVHDEYRAWSLARRLRRVEQGVLGGRAPADTLPREVVASFEAHLRALVHAQRARGIVPVLATYPTLGAATGGAGDRALLLDERTYRPELSERGLVDASSRLNEAVRRVAAELAVPLADADAAVPKTRAYFADYVHYTDAGAQRVAETVLGTLARHGLLGPAAAQVTPAGQRTVPDP